MLVRGWDGGKKNTMLKLVQGLKQSKFFHVFGCREFMMKKKPKMKKKSMRKQSLKKKYVD